MTPRYYTLTRNAADSHLPGRDMADEDRRFDPTRRSPAENDENANPLAHSFYPIAYQAAKAYDTIRRKLLSSPTLDGAAAEVCIQDIVPVALRELAMSSFEALWRARALFAGRTYQGLSSPSAIAPPLVYSVKDGEKELHGGFRGASLFRALGLKWHTLTRHCKTSYHMQNIARIRLDSEIDSILGDTNLSVDTQVRLMMNIRNRLHN